MKSICSKSFIISFSISSSFLLFSLLSKSSLTLKSELLISSSILELGFSFISLFAKKSFTAFSSLKILWLIICLKNFSIFFIISFFSSSLISIFIKSVFVGNFGIRHPGYFCNKTLFICSISLYLLFITFESFSYMIFISK